jgi:hypothetical protein
LIEEDPELVNQARRALPASVQIVNDVSELHEHHFTQVLLHDTPSARAICAKLRDRSPRARVLRVTADGRVFVERFADVAANVCGTPDTFASTARSALTEQGNTNTESDAEPASGPRLPPIRVGSGPSWAGAVFHVLAHVDLTSLPASIYSKRYVRWAAQQLGQVAHRELGDVARVLAKSVRSHEYAARLQTLAWLFRDTEQALACAERPLTSLLPRDTAVPRWLNAARALGPEAEVLRCSVLLELPQWQRLAPTHPETEALEHHLGELGPIVPELYEHGIEMLPALTGHGRVHAGTIWIGCPCAELGTTPLQLAWQAAHEALVSTLNKSTRNRFTEREVEQRAGESLKTRARNAGLYLREDAS